MVLFRKFVASPPFCSLGGFMIFRSGDDQGNTITSGDSSALHIPLDVGRRKAALTGSATVSFLPLLQGTRDKLLTT